jgi:hypothetical protein
VSSRIVISLVVGLGLLVAPAQTVAAEPDFPAGYEGYHTYAELDAALDDAVADHGAILKRSVIGQSYEGRDIWVVKISDRVGRDESEPEVLSECGMHAREHITVEMCLYMIDLLTDNYGKSTALGKRVTKLVNTREIWIIPSLNPDGAEYNISGGEFHGWRKNRQVNPGSDKVGIDLNRNWGYMWNCCGGSGGQPKSARYRGQFPFEAVENRVLRDFILSRRVGGLQQITIVFNWHSYGEFVMWPYGFTRTDVPPQMTEDDHDVFVTIGQQMAALNGYKSKQGSDSYIYDGDFPAWAYGDQRMFVYTFEMYPRWGCNGCGAFKPPDEVIERETTRNRDAVLYFLEQADCVYRAAGLGDTHCGQINDDFEVGRGWKLGGSSAGQWERGVPSETSTGGEVMQRSNVPSGMADLVTGAAAGGAAAANDVDGLTWAKSRLFRATGKTQVTFTYTFAHSAGSSSADFFRLRVKRGSSLTTIWSQEGDSSARGATWQTVTLSLSAFGGKNVRLQFEANDGGADDVVEAAIDDVRVYKTP